jgi:hypothetical protein
MNKANLTRCIKSVIETNGEITIKTVSDINKFVPLIIEANATLKGQKKEGGKKKLTGYNKFIADYSKGEPKQRFGLAVTEWRTLTPEQKEVWNKKAKDFNEGIVSEPEPEPEQKVEEKPKRGGRKPSAPKQVKEKAKPTAPKKGRGRKPITPQPVPKDDSDEIMDNEEVMNMISGIDDEDEVFDADLDDFEN